MTDTPGHDDQPASWLAPLASLSAMGAMVAAHDWSSTPLGPVERWPVALRLAVRTCLSTRFPMLVVAGPQMIKIYNDGYRMMLGTQKHPRALGAPASEIWEEIWDTVGPLFDHVYATGEPTWSEDLPLLIERQGFTEECYFTFSYSPVFDDEGDVIGVIDIATETTETVLVQRRLGCLGDLSGSLVAATDADDVCVRAVEAMSRWESSIRSVEIHLWVEGHLVPVASSRAQGPTDARSFLVEIGPPTPGDLPVPEVAVPIARAGEDPFGVMVLALNESRPFDADYAGFVTLLSRSIGAALEQVHRHAVEVDTYRRISDTLQRTTLQLASDTSPAARYLAATGDLVVGGDWYDMVDLPGDCIGLVVGDCVGHGLEAAAAMSQLRAAARAMLLQGNDPAGTLDGLDRFSRSVEGASNATVVCMIFDQEASTLTYARAGHPYPLVVGPAGSTWLRAGGPPLGLLATPQYPNATHRFGADDVIVCYSDGLIERRGEDIDAGFARLAELASGLPGRDLQDAADELIEAMLLPEPEDDVVLVLVPGSRPGS